MKRTPPFQRATLSFLARAQVNEEAELQGVVARNPHDDIVEEALLSQGRHFATGGSRTGCLINCVFFNIDSTERWGLLLVSP